MGFQLCSIAASTGPDGEVPAAVMLPLGVDGCQVFRAAPDEMRVEVQVRQGNTCRTGTLPLRP